MCQDPPWLCFSAQCNAAESWELQGCYGWGGAHGWLFHRLCPQIWFRACKHWTYDLWSPNRTLVYWVLFWNVFSYIGFRIALMCTIQYTININTLPSHHHLQLKKIIFSFILESKGLKWAFTSTKVWFWVKFGLCSCTYGATQKKQIQTEAMLSMPTHWPENKWLLLWKKTPSEPDLENTFPMQDFCCSMSLALCLFCCQQRGHSGKVKSASVLVLVGELLAQQWTAF